jgi:hypothetical protein
MDPDPYNWITDLDADPDPGFFLSDYKMPTKSNNKFISIAYYIPKVYIYVSLQIYRKK